MMETREPLEWHFRQLDQSMGLSFKTYFNFAMVGHLLKGFRHPVTNTVARTIRVLNVLLLIAAKANEKLVMLLLWNGYPLASNLV